MSAVRFKRQHSLPVASGSSGIDNERKVTIAFQAGHVFMEIVTSLAALSSWLLAVVSQCSLWRCWVADQSPHCDLFCAQPPTEN